MSDTYVKNRQKRSAPSFGGVYTPLSHPPSWASDPNWDELANLPNHSRKLYVLVGGIPTLWKRGVSRDGYSIPNWMESHKIPWFQSPPRQFLSGSVVAGVPFFGTPEGPWLVSAFELCKSPGCDWASTAVSAGAQTLSSLLVGEERDSH